MIDRRSEQSPIFDQGPRGTCAACAVTSWHEWLHEREALSVEDALFQGKKGDLWPGEDATSVEHALRGIASFGHAIERAWPYGVPAYPSPSPTAAMLASNRRHVPGAWSGAPPSSSAFHALDTLLHTGCAILTVSFIPDAWNRADGVIDAPPGLRSDDLHAVLSVGSTAHSTAGPVIIVKNSWGAAWGDGGYGYMTAAYVDTYVIEAHMLRAAA